MSFAGSLGSIPYPILSDFYPHGSVAKAYGVFDNERGTPKRAEIIIDTTGVVRFSRLYDNATDLDPRDILNEIDNI